MDTLDAKRIIEKQGRRGIVRSIDLPAHLCVDGKVLLVGHRENGDVVRIDYISTGETSGMFGVFVESVFTAPVTNLMSFFVPKYVLAEHTEAALAHLLVEADIPFTLTDIRGR